MQFYDFLNTIENTSSLKEKEAALKAALAGDSKVGAQVKLLVNAAYNYKMLFYIRDLPETTGAFTDAVYTDDTWVGEFLGLLNECGKTGRTQATKQMVIDWLAKQNDNVAKWCRRAILRDLRAGFGVDLANKCGYEIPAFEVQLATDGKKCKKLAKLLPGRCGPKLDGYRCFAVVENGKVSLLSRNGHPFNNFPAIEAAVEEWAKRLGTQNMVVDGEIMSDNFEAMQKSAFAAKRGTTVGDVYYGVFDWVPYEEYVKSEFAAVAEVRYSALRSIAPHMPDGIRLVEHLPVSTEEQILEAERTFMAKGFEGAMFKPNIPYYQGKSSNRMLKFKTMLSQDCVVTGMVEGEGKYVGMMGALVVRQENGETCEVGTGFADSARAEFWANKTDVVGRLIEVKYQELTSDNIMRFPVFKRFRDQGLGSGKI